MARRKSRRARGMDARAAVKPLLLVAALAGLTALAWQELPALRREIKIMMM